MKHHIELQGIRSVEIEMQDGTENLKVSASPDGKVFGKCLDYAEYKGVEPIHLLYVVFLVVSRKVTGTILVGRNILFIALGFPSRRNDNGNTQSDKSDESDGGSYNYATYRKYIGVESFRSGTTAEHQQKTDDYQCGGNTHPDKIISSQGELRRCLRL